MALKIYDTLSRKEKSFKPRTGKKVKMFVCGPTVYDFIHVGNARSYVVFDVVARYLRYLGHDLFYLQNITDVDDKTIKRAKEEKTTFDKLAKKFTDEYFIDIERLNIHSVDKYAPATEYIKEIIDQINRLTDKGFAYSISDGVYFDISKFEEFGKLSKQKLEELKKHRVEPNPEKRNPGDFSLWKFEKPGEPAWEAPFGRGRPGWHIEDTAITEKFFGPQYDIHGGGQDLIFPHHECEIAQIEAVSGKKPLVNYWIHNGFVKIEGRKMSKSLGNFVTARDAIAKHGAEIMRFFYSTTHYRAPLDYKEEALITAKNQYSKLKNGVLSINYNLNDIEAVNDFDTEVIKQFELRKKEFLKGMDDDFNTSKALAALFALVGDANKTIFENKASKNSLQYALSVFFELATILGFLEEVEERDLTKEEKELVQKREDARKARNYKSADKIRDDLAKKGVIVEDTPKGPRVRFE